MSLQRNLFKPENIKLFTKYLKLTELTDIKNVDEKILKLYTSLKEHIPRLIENGFTEDFKNINHKEWMIFITKAIVKIDELYDSYSRQEKLELLTMICIYIIILHLPIDPITKEFLIVYIKEFIPEITESLITMTKKMHTLYQRLKKKIKCCKK